MSQIADEAQRENIVLSEPERKMLYFSESGWTLPDLSTVADEFDGEFFSDKMRRRRAAGENVDHLQTVFDAALVDFLSEDDLVAVVVDALVEKE